MIRRDFLAHIGIGTAALLVAPQLAFGKDAKGDRIITLDTPGAGHLGLFKNGMQIGVVYWANLDTKQYRRIALTMDFLEGPWEGGGEIVRHPNLANVTHIGYRSLHIADAEAAHKGHLLPVDGKYRIDQYRMVDYLSPFPTKADPKANIRTTPLSVEGTFDECLLVRSPSPEFQALYPGLRVQTQADVEKRFGLSPVGSV